MAITSKYQIDGEQAIKTIEQIQGQFVKYNSALGSVISQSAKFNQGAKGSIQTLVQVDLNGRKTTSTIRQLGDSFVVLSTKVGAASNAQRKQATELEKQAETADRLAKLYAQAPSSPTVATRSISTTIGAVDPRSIGLQANAYAGLTQAQLLAAANANKLNESQRNALVSIASNSGKARAALNTLLSPITAIGNKLDEVGKIAFATLIYRGISLLTQAFSEGAKDAIDYVHQIGLIQTISQDSGESFDTWNASIRAVADELGRPAGEVAIATYDAISNQVVRTTKDFDFLRTAITLERNTGSSAGSGLNTLSALINALGVSASQAGTLADILFVSIDKGRIRLEELDAVIGRTVQLQSQAGVNFYETSGALDVLTQSGLKADEATTLLNNIFSEIIKPNDALSAALHKLGYETGQEANQALGLANVLKTLGDLARSTPDGLATFFPDIRGLRGASTLFTQVDQFKSTIQSLEASQGKNDFAKNILGDNPAEQLIKEGNRIKNFFTVDLGVAIIQTVAKISTAFGGFSNVLKNISSAAAITAGAVALVFTSSKVIPFLLAVDSVRVGFIGLTAQIGLTNAATLVFNTNIAAARVTALAFLGSTAGAVTIVTAAFVAAALATNRYYDALQNGAEQRFKPIDANTSALTSQNKKDAAQRVKDFNSATDNMTGGLLQFVAKARGLNDELKANFKKTFQDIGDSVKNAFSVALTFVKRNLTDIEAAEQKSFDNIKTLGEKARDLQQSFEERQTERSIENIQKTYEYQKSLAEQNGSSFSSAPFFDAFAKIATEQSNAAKKARDQALAAGDTDEAIKQAEKLADIANQYKKNIESVGGQVNVNQLDKVNNADNQNAFNKALKDAPALYDQNAKAAETARLNVEKYEDTLKALKDLTKDAFTKEGLISPEFEGDANKVIARFNELNDQRKQLQTVQPRSKNPVIAAREDAGFAGANAAAENLKNGLQTQLSIATNNASLKKISEGITEVANTAKQKFDSLNADSLNLANQTATNLGAVRKALGELSTTLSSFGGTVDPIQKLSNFLLQGGFTNTGPIKATIDQIKELTSATTVDIPAVLAKINQLKTQTAGIKNNQIVNPNDASSVITIEEAIKGLTDNINSYAAAKSQIKDNTVDASALQQQLKGFDTTAFGQVSQIINGIGTASSNLSKATGGPEALKAALDNATSSAVQLKTLLESITKIQVPQVGGIPASVDGGGAVEPHASGGVVGAKGGFLADFYSGKFSRGTDTIPTMLTRGEFVVRASAARKFYSQLVAINSNSVPQYRAEGGSVGSTNNTTHSYSININGGSDSPTKTAKTVVQAIRRAQRQGTIS